VLEKFRGFLPKVVHVVQLLIINTGIYFERISSNKIVLFFYPITCCKCLVYLKEKKRHHVKLSNILKNKYI